MVIRDHVMNRRRSQVNRLLHLTCCWVSVNCVGTRDLIAYLDLVQLRCTLQIRMKGILGTFSSEGVKDNIQWWGRQGRVLNIVHVHVFYVLRTWSWQWDRKLLLVALCVWWTLLILDWGNLSPGRSLNWKSSLSTRWNEYFLQYNIYSKEKEEPKWSQFVFLQFLLWRLWSPTTFDCKIPWSHRGSGASFLHKKAVRWKTQITSFNQLMVAAFSCFVTKNDNHPWNPFSLDPIAS